VEGAKLGSSGKGLVEQVQGHEFKPSKEEKKILSNFSYKMK
jgi:hypothetical protein